MDINERARQIKAAQEAAREQAAQARDIERQQALQRQQESNRHKREVSELLDRFVSWAKRHRIPTDVSSHWTKYSQPILPYSTGSRDKKLRGWCIASHSDTYRADGDQHPTTRYYAIAKNGGIYSTRHTPEGQYAEVSGDLNLVTIDSINEHIARLVAKHNIPWD